MKPSTDPIALHYPVWLRAFAASLIVLPVAVAWQVWVAVPAAPEDTFTNLLPWLVLGCWLVATYQVFLVELYYDDRCITQISPLAGVVFLNWSDVVALYYVRGLEGYVLETGDGRRILFNDWRSGVPDFAAAIQSRLPRQAQGGQ